MSQGDQMPLFFTFEGLDSTDGTTNKGAWYGKEGWMPPLKYEVLSFYLSSISYQLFLLRVTFGL
jgi:hypothetical protein